MRPIAHGLACLTLLLNVAPLRAAGDDADARAARMTEHERHYFGIARDVIMHCGEASTDPDTIVVCAVHRADPRYDPPEAPAPPEAKMIALGAPTAGHGVGAGVTIRGCFLQKCPKELYFIDVKAIPEGAPGSDADRIGKGELR